MAIPKDPVILLSYVNTQLRDNYPNLTELCESLDINESELVECLGAIQYQYDPGQNQFK
ncbi:DUF4250 domain-containing protein [Anaerocolumna sp. AGMB13025]|uniref:DUF4250 domain-containing protein n=1 Tax=Anaerocolumna sp. AGMB13025 TaxID=3039116 RepID=UPI00241CCAB1|nr:DUF4250 domain-containing protein [Anaerocolumna sp. AGMB13025]WFR58348.1 DUF4250 domain-containing protein [Anaerocolumna sp. AGMB13025]